MEKNKPEPSLWLVFITDAMLSVSSVINTIINQNSLTLDPIFYRRIHVRLQVHTRNEYVIYSTRTCV